MPLNYELKSGFKPAGDQPEAIEKLTQGLKKEGKQTLLGVTGSGKTFTIANMLAKSGKSALIISHNKTLAAQLYSEFKEFFPNNKVGYFVSYFDYYQPESYLPATDTYIEKDSKVNEQIEKMRLQATSHLLSDGPSIIVATVSCIYGIGDPQEYRKFSAELNEGGRITRKELIIKLLDMQYERNERAEVTHGKFSVKGGVFTIAPAYDDYLLRVSLEDDVISSIQMLDAINLKPTRKLRHFTLFPAKHYLVGEDARKRAAKSIRAELEEQLPRLGDMEAHRLSQRTKYDLELLDEVGYCNGIENYSRHFDNRMPGEPAFCLIDFLPEDALIIIDESHVTLPQLHAMYHGDRTRKKNLVDFGFRLPSAYDNRPLKWEEFEKKLKTGVFVSATPSQYERENSFQIVEQLVRPTGILDPKISVRKSEGQMDDLLQMIKIKTKEGSRTLVTTLTKRMAEDLAEYMAARDVKVRYLHSEIDTITRSELIRQLRMGEYDVLVGINLLREGLDIPEVGLVAILDADKEGFLRNPTSLIQTIGRAARNANSQVIMYASKISNAMREAIEETDRRRAVQEAFNTKHNIVPVSVKKKVGERLGPEGMQVSTRHLASADMKKQIIILEEEMKLAAENLDFEQAISIRDQITDIKKKIKQKKKSAK
ncbi:excinuclease ABC subunit B [Candidatus Micrarchaeota archaeon CG10_big_fil_rev_8_21_14_0_10_45_29]|nr:MAG: excinuclease ABC subunit B [Candidatus Micrarchaeota archaeon CG10_big_fil_rev_8_21_14_0_10_45_29]